MRRVSICHNGERVSTYPFLCSDTKIAVIVGECLDTDGEHVLAEFLTFVQDGFFRISASVGLVFPGVVDTVFVFEDCCEKSETALQRHAIRGAEQNHEYKRDSLSTKLAVYRQILRLVESCHEGVNGFGFEGWLGVEDTGDVSVKSLRERSGGTIVKHRLLLEGSHDVGKTVSQVLRHGRQISMSELE